METGSKVLLGLGALGAIGGVGYLAYRAGRKRANAEMAEGFRKEGFGYLGTVLAKNASSPGRPIWYAGDLKVIPTGYQVTIYTKTSEGSLVKAGTGVVSAAADGGGKIDIVDSTIAPWDPKVGEPIVLASLEKVSGGRVYPWGYPMPNQDINEMVSLATHGTGAAFDQNWVPNGPIDPIPTRGRAQWGGVRTIAVATHGVAGAKGWDELGNFAGMGRMGTQTPSRLGLQAPLGARTHAHALRRSR